MRKALDEPTKAEAVVVGTDQPPHSLHSLNKPRLPTAELLSRGVSFFEAVAHGVGCHLSRAEREQHARRVEWVEEPKRIADEDPAIAGRSLGPIGIFLGGSEWA